MRVIDGYLSRQAQLVWPNAIVYRESMVEPVERERMLSWIRDVLAWLGAREEDPDSPPHDGILPEGIRLSQDLNVDDRGGIILYVLERPDDDPLGLGATFKEAKQAVMALQHQKGATR